MQNLRNLKHKILFIVQADYNAKRTRISEVKVLYFENRQPKQEIQTCKQIVSYINDDGFDIATAAVDSQNELHFAEVLTYPIDNDWFIKTKANKQPEDNLGELPPISR